MPRQISSPTPIIYVQYTNPAAYPPLEHSSRILAGRNWQVLFLGIGAHGAHGFRFAEHASITVKELGVPQPGWRQKVHYIIFTAWVIFWTVWLRPAWLYVSDPLACPAALLAKRFTGVHVLYHEHDSPSTEAPSSWFMRRVFAARAQIGRLAEVCVLPQERRLARFAAEVGRQGPTYCVWNCPRREEAAEAKTVSNGALRFHYHGSLNKKRLPAIVLQALAAASGNARLTIVGYETAGHRGYVKELLALAQTLNLHDRVSYLGLATRADCIRLAAEADVGLAFMPMDNSDRNLTDMVGASNKPFDYLAVGQLLLVSDLPDWRGMFADQGYAIACDPDSFDDLARVVGWCVENPEIVRAMGEFGRKRILADWNYETQFEPVLKCINGEI